MGQSSKEEQELYFYCFYHVYANVYPTHHVNYHHVIMKIKDSEYDTIKVLDTDAYQYRLISAQPVFLDEKDLDGLVIRGLRMDGESLLKRFKSAKKKNHSTIVE